MMVEPIQLAPEQIEAFTSRLGQNNRPIQQLYGRTVRLSEVL